MSEQDEKGPTGEIKPPTRDGIPEANRSDTGDIKPPTPAAPAPPTEERDTGDIKPPTP